MLTLVQSVATVLLASLAAQDLRDRRLSNRVVLAFAALYFVAAALARDGFAPLAGHVATGAAMLLLFAGMRHAGWIGGGDVKLAAAVFLWAGPALVFPVLTGIGAGGALCGLALLASRPRRAAPVRAVAARGVPYGVALALGGTLAVWVSFPHTVSLT
ncbi:prepilin peptidase [Burkholderia sp. AU30198]|uniref:Type 4 prepilin peptidase 1 n=3 Tax=Burkholderia TaxID=32008 RepID=A0A6J5IUT7_9BURK|nr:MULTISPECIES: prepilin peptidase [Burkholderia]MCA8292330.1 prepilin peptidase [Burkholderia sp. AU30198]CAB3964120.1 type 4 prepilin peptidase 1 [Burkholderia aenigmatica]